MRFSLYILASLIFLLSCNSQNFKPASGPAAHSATAAVDKSTAGAITGTISFYGAAPKLLSLDMSQDPGCPSGPQQSDAVVVKNGKLANVFIYVKEGLGEASFSASPEAVIVDQKGCRYIPHVLGIMAGQPLKILNNDNAEHNVHPMPRNNDEWNESQVPRGRPITKTFHQPELMMPVQCNQHPWMKMYVNVVKTPFFAVTGSDGKYEIKGLPPGDYTLAFVQEKLGEQTQKVTLAAKDSKTVDQGFKAQ